MSSLFSTYKTMGGWVSVHVDSLCLSDICPTHVGFISHCRTTFPINLLIGSQLHYISTCSKLPLAIITNYYTIITNPNSNWKHVWVWATLMENVLCAGKSFFWWWFVMGLIFFLLFFFVRIIYINKVRLKILQRFNEQENAPVIN